MATVDIKVPDIGDFQEVRVIEVLVVPGDRVEEGQSLIVVETDKATMEVPSSHGGVVKELKLKVDDKVSAGTTILSLEADAAAATAVLPSTASAPAPESMSKVAPVVASAAASHSGSVEFECDVLVLGAGPGGYSAAFRAADLGMHVVLVERYATLGGVCLNVGCIPSKALLHVTAVMDEATTHFADRGVRFGEPEVDLDRLRMHKNSVVDKLTSGLAGMARSRKVQVIHGHGSFLDAQHVQVEETNTDSRRPTGNKQVVRFKRAIIAAGSQAVHLPFLPDDPRIVDSTGALELRQKPARMLIIGGGIIGLEMGTVYSTLGARLDVVEMLDELMPGADRDLVKVWQKLNASRFDNVLLRTKTVAAEATPQGILVSFEGDCAPKEPQLYDLVLQAVGRSPNGKRINAERAGVSVDERGFIPVDSQMRTTAARIFAIGDIVGQPMLAHKAVHEAHVAAEVAAGEILNDAKLRLAAFDARAIPSVAYTHPEIAWVGLTETQAKAEGRKLKKGIFPWAASGRAIANGCDEGFTKLLFDEATQRIVGGGIVGSHAGDMIGEIALAIEMGANDVDIGKTIHPHPTLCESIGMAAEVAHGTCTDVPPARRQ
ncbi:dihydrolipoyl dehydrogenase [Pseudomonas putida]|uniref:Dihydrolipoyl dehydrogenase n=1 Tax=Pseudomonas putida TaxID=303 RepID=A0AAW6PR43_PSEPU|nr:dihydrolipoyl dehydrogenase [Pseudomonas putida]MDF3872099.1 dihydrolipoyl dehydrogenase [Pseudomonas putida]MDF3877008.1 dihydrolipoyl dehydrogenase [Pseudomonas putida]